MSFKVLRHNNGNQKKRRWNYAEIICSFFNINDLLSFIDHDRLYGLHKKS